MDQFYEILLPYLRQPVLDSGHHHIDCDLVVAAFRDDDVGELFGWFDEDIVGGFYGFDVLVDDGIQCATPFLDIPADTADNPEIRVGVHENLDIHQIAQALILQDQNALQYDDVLGVHRLGGCYPCVDGEVVGGFFNGLLVEKAGDMRYQEIRIECEGVIVVGFDAFFKGKVGLVLVVGILLQDGDVLFRQ